MGLAQARPNYTLVWMGSSLRGKNYGLLFANFPLIMIFMARIQQQSPTLLPLFNKTLSSKQYSIHRRHGCSSIQRYSCKLPITRRKTQISRLTAISQRNTILLKRLNDSCPNFVPCAAASCTKVHSATVNKCKFAHFV